MSHYTCNGSRIACSACSRWSKLRITVMVACRHRNQHHYEWYSTFAVERLEWKQLPCFSSHRCQPTRLQKSRHGQHQLQSRLALRWCQRLVEHSASCRIE